MPTGSGLWHFLYRLVRKFIRSVVSSEKEIHSFIHFFIATNVKRIRRYICYD